ncbi:MAG: aldehyde dehydrogenase family protein [Kineosporiaceae bacterium]
MTTPAPARPAAGTRRIPGHFVAGQWTAPRRTTQIDVHDSNTGEVMGSAPDGTTDEVAAAVAAAAGAQREWAANTPAQRAAALRAVADRLETRLDELADTIAREVGAVAGVARGPQVHAPLINLRSAADIAEGYAYRSELGPTLIAREPIGVVGAITAWNFPLHLVTVKAAHAIAAGNTVVVKPSEVAPLSIGILCEAVAAAGLPPGVFNVVFGTGPEAGEALVRHPAVRMVSFTGSTRAGRRIGELASQQIKKVTLELGGKSPLVVLPGADLEAAVRFGVTDCMLNNGQRCDALTRMIVPRSTLAEVEELATGIVAGLTVGSSVDEGTDVGPLVSAAQLARVRGYLATGVAEGARLLVGGVEPPALPRELQGGYFVRPSLFSDVDRRMTIAQEEIFGPVLAVQAYETVDEAVALANDTIYGLHSAVYADTRPEALDVAARLESGMVSVNGGQLNMQAPFGGYKQSGLGREFGPFGFDEFLEVKKVEVSP